MFTVKTPMSFLRAGLSKCLCLGRHLPSNWNFKYKYFLHKEKEKCGCGGPSTSLHVVLKADPRLEGYVADDKVDHSVCLQLN